jgi:hypothetical protein
MIWIRISSNLTWMQGGAMDLDRIAARLAEHRAHRRAALQAGGAGVVAALSVAGTHLVTAQDATPVAGDTLPDTVHLGAAAPPSEFLFVQSFASGSIVPVDGQSDLFTLRLDGTNPQTVFFSDRPERVFGLATTSAFLEGLGFSPDDPPNAALVVTTEDGDEDVVIIELLDPVWDEASGALTYTVQMLSDYEESGLAYAALQQTDYDLPEQFGQGGLFVDGCSNDRLYCYQYKADGTKGEPVGPTKPTPFCFDASSKKCLPCSSASIVCAESYPVQCIDRSGSQPRLRCGGLSIS